MNPRYICCILIIIALTISIIGCVKNQPMVIPGEDVYEDNFNIVEIKNFILKANSLRYNLGAYNLTGLTIGVYDGIDVLEIEGDYAEYNKVLELMGVYFNEEVIDIELAKENLVNMNGKIGYIAAGGENRYYITDNSEFQLLVSEKDLRIVEVNKFGEYGGEVRRKYTLSKKNNNWKITHQESDFNYEGEEPEIIIYQYDWSTVTASSSLENYDVNLTLDGSKDTSWSEGVEDDGINEWVKFEKDHDYKVSGIKIINGYAETEELYYENNRVKRIKIEFSDGTYLEKELEDDQLFWYQEIMFNEKVKTKYVKITILDVYKGTKYRDTCIAEVIVFN